MSRNATARNMSQGDARSARRPRSARRARYRATATAAALAAVACSDLALEPDRVPSSLSLEPADTLIVEGDRARLRATVFDQDGEPFPGLPSWAPPRWSPSDPAAVSIAPDGSLDALGGGEIQVEAQVAGLKAWTTVRINASSVTLSASAIYLVQAAQNLQGSVPVVAGRKALLRVFVTSDPGSFYQPRGRASFFLDGEETYSTFLLPGSYLIPDAVDESRIDRSFNALIPGSVLQPGVEMAVELDLEGVVPLAPGSQVRVPAEGRMTLDVRDVPDMELTVVPVLLEPSPDPQIFTWTSGMNAQSSALRLTRAVLPIGHLDVRVREAYSSSADLTTTEGWNGFLREVAVLRVADGGSGYYYGAVELPPGSRWGGMGFVGAPVSVGAPRENTLAHELGHNFSLRHAPCGGVSSWDAAYPHDGGSIGVWGYDFLGGAGIGKLIDPDQYVDLMGYCTPRWISDYHFTKAMIFRIDEESPAATRSPAEPVLLLWGSAGEEELLLEPAFAVEAPPVLPVEEGPYRLDGYDGAGGQVFSLRFSPREASQGGRHFAFAVPLSPEAVTALDAIRLTGPTGALTVDRTTSRSPVALVTDDATGRVRAILRSDEVTSARSPGVTVTISRGLPPASGREGGE